VRQHRRDDVGIVDLAAREGIAAAQHNEPVPDQRAILENRELPNERRGIGDRLGEGERLPLDLLPGHHRKVFAQDLPADRNRASAAARAKAARARSSSGAPSAAA